MVRRVTAKIDVDAAGAEQGAGVTERASKRIGDTFDGLKGKATGFGVNFKEATSNLLKDAKDKLGPFGDALDKVGIDLEKMNPKALVAGGGIAALVGFTAQGIQKFSALTKEVQAYTSAAGVSAEEGSRLNAVLKGVGLEAEDGADVLKTLAEIAGTDADKFKTYGVEIAKARDGTVDMTATLGNVAERFKQMRDPAERAAMGSELFGDSWVKIAPILSRGRDGLDDLLGSVSKSSIVTEDAIKANQEMGRKMAELRQGVDNLQMAVGKEALPEFVDDLQALVFVLDKVNAANDKVNFIGIGKGIADQMNPLKGLIGAWSEWEGQKRGSLDITPQITAAGTAMLKAAGEAAPLAKAEEDVARAAQLAKAGQEEAKKASDDLKASYEAQKAAADKLQGATLTIAGSALAAESAERNLSSSVADVDAKHKALSDTLNTTTEDSDEAKKATKEYDDALLSAKQAAEQHAQAQVDLAQQTAEASGQTFTAEQASLVYRDALVKVRDQSNDPDLVAGLDGLIGLVDANAQAAWRAQAAADAAAAALSRMEAAASGALQTDSSGAVVGSADTNAERIDGARASGGPVNAGSRYLVGEQGPEIVEFGRSGMVTPLDRLEQQAAGAGRPLVVQLVVDGRTLTEQTIPYHELERRSRQ